MNKQEIIEQIVSILEKVNDVSILKDMLNLVNGVYKHFVSGKIGR